MTVGNEDNLYVNGQFSNGFNGFISLSVCIRRTPSLYGSSYVSNMHAQISGQCIKIDYLDRILDYPPTKTALP